MEPTKKQEEFIEWTIMRCRLLYNAALEQRIFAYKKRGKPLSYNQQANELPKLKKVWPEYKQIHSQVLQDVLKRLDKAFESFFRRLRNGEKPGFPRFQGKNRYDSFTYPQSGFSIEGKYLRLSKIGTIRMKLHRQIEGNIKTCTIKRKNGKYYACFNCEIEVKAQKTGQAVGVDMGIKYLATTSDGEFFAHPKHLRKSERKLKYLQRMVSRRQKGSNRRKKAVLLLAKHHEKIANQRKDTNHKVSRTLIDRYDLIVFEDLNVQGMVKNHHLSKSIIDASWHQLIRFTTYKAAWAGKRVVLVDPKNTSQECSECGAIVKKTLDERIHKCHHCGYESDRDINASRNILHRGIKKIKEQARNEPSRMDVGCYAR